MRNHLLQCFEKVSRLDAANITTFKPFKYESKEILSCVCGMPKDKTMTPCKTCGQLFHKACITLSIKDSKNGDWNCSSCTQLN